VEKAAREYTLGAYNSGKSGNPVNLREFINSGKVRELRINKHREFFRCSFCVAV